MTHLLEYTIDWDQSGTLLPGCTKDPSEYGEDLDISSLSRLSGERAYLQELKRKRNTELIDIVKEYDQLEDGKDRQPLEYWEKTYSRSHKSNLVGRKLKSKGMTAVK